MANNPNQLLVEDTDIQGVVIGLMPFFLAKPWGETDSARLVHISGKRGKTQTIDYDAIYGAIYGSDIERVGIIVDADTSADETWAKVRGVCARLGVDVGEKCPKSGLITPIDGRRFGAWIMPDNEAAGMVENLCHDLVKDKADALWVHAKASADKAKKLGAPFSGVHMDKAHIHTWLAWQDEPGLRMGIAIKNKVLNHAHERTKAFAKWFADLYELELKAGAI